jgi:hypothetical protein
MRLGHARHYAWSTSSGPSYRPLAVADRVHYSETGLPEGVHQMSAAPVMK